ncbi:hypothetical protein BASA60_002491, partial [Batrachochytrium salamandrivorans]
LADLEDEAAKMFKWRSKLPITTKSIAEVDIVNELQQVKQSILHLPTINSNTGIRLMRHAGSILHLRDASTSVAPLVRFVQDFQLENLDVALGNAVLFEEQSTTDADKTKIQLATIEPLAAFLQTGTHIDVDVIIRMHALLTR